MAVDFGNVDKIESAANFCKLPLALYLETHSIFRRLPDMTTTRDEDIDLETGSMCQSVIIGSLTLIWKLDFDFGEKVIFQRFEPILS